MAPSLRAVQGEMPNNSHGPDLLHSYPRAEVVHLSHHKSRWIDQGRSISRIMLGVDGVARLDINRITMRC